MSKDAAYELLRAKIEGCVSRRLGHHANTSAKLITPSQLILEAWEGRPNVIGQLPEPIFAPYANINVSSYEGASRNNYSTGVSLSIYTLQKAKAGWVGVECLHQFNINTGKEIALNVAQVKQMPWGEKRLVGHRRLSYDVAIRDLQALDGILAKSGLGLGYREWLAVLAKAPFTASRTRRTPEESDWFVN